MKPPLIVIALVALVSSMVARPVALVGQDTLPTARPVVKVLAGDPAQAGPSAVRITFPAGFHTDPHHHGVDLAVRVRSGRLMMGWGITFDTTRVVAFQPGSSTVIPAGKDHFDWFPEGAEVDYESKGPWETTFVDTVGTSVPSR
jgi:mannose-6-phosphate isomerase-like protein (cupin superfamily)